MKKQRNSKQRQLILEAVMGRHDHPTADQIYMQVREQDEKISRGTVYRNLGLLSDSGKITDVQLSTADRYDSRLDRHYHLYCVQCGRVFDAPLPYHAEDDAQVTAETGFAVRCHHVLFEGVCPECMALQQEGASKEE
ncbi:MAG: transcriptional repressor [Oscillospiraceae bacterium]|nr:transcriptional repressor [Oscillospiraceae bacterium]